MITMQINMPIRLRNWKEKLDFLKITREQISVVKATLRSVNSTLCTVLENEKILSKGLEE